MRLVHHLVGHFFKLYNAKGEFSETYFFFRYRDQVNSIFAVL